MLIPYGTVISTRILRDTNSYSKGVGFARYSKLTPVLDGVIFIYRTEMSRTLEQHNAS